MADQEAPRDPRKVALKPTNVEQIDLEKMREMAAENPGLLPYAHTSGGAVIKPTDVGKVKGRAVSAMRQQTEMQLGKLYEQMQLLAKQANQIKDRVEVSERIYNAKLGFEPLIGQVYYLYQKTNGDDTLSLVGPEEWGRSLPFAAYVAQVKMLADHTWEVLDIPAEPDTIDPDAEIE